jgi:hypothetical protein
MITAKLIGGPLDGGNSPVPMTAPIPKSLPCQVFGDDGYAYTTLDGVLAWHYIGKIKWTPEEAERRKREAN